jgi:hypothetical protein
MEISTGLDRILQELLHNAYMGRKVLCIPTNRIRNVHSRPLPIHNTSYVNEELSRHRPQLVCFSSRQQTIIDISIVISLLVFAIRVLLKEARGVLNDFFQIIEFLIRWWILIRDKLRGKLDAAQPAPAE